MEDTTAFLMGTFSLKTQPLSRPLTWQSSAMDSVRPRRGSREQAHKFFSTLVLNLVLAGDGALAVPRDRATRDYQAGRYNTKGLTLNSIKYQQRLVDAGMLQMAMGSFEEGECTTVRPPARALVENYSSRYLIIDGLERIGVGATGVASTTTTTKHHYMARHFERMLTSWVPWRSLCAVVLKSLPSFPRRQWAISVCSQGKLGLRRAALCHNVQNLRSKSVKERQTITFDGKATEPDFSGQHPRMLYIMEGSATR